MKNGPYMMDLHNIVVAVNCCFILHNMTVVECINSNMDGTKDGNFYEVVDDNVDENVDDEATVHHNPALAYVCMEEEHVDQQLLEVKYLQALGINVHDCELRHDVERLRILPQFSCMAQYRWGELYDAYANHQLTQSIITKLHRKYCNYKVSK
jgi:hypothetical protein